MSYDGKEVWARDWGVGNTPVFETYFFYWFVNLPWLTQESYVNLGPVGTDRLPGIEKDLHTVRLEFTQAPSIGKSEHDAFELFIDPDDGLLRGYRYWSGCFACTTTLRRSMASSSRRASTPWLPMGRRPTATTR